MGLELEQQVDAVDQEQELECALVGRGYGVQYNDTYNAGAMADGQRLLLGQLFVGEGPVEHRLSVE